MRREVAVGQGGSRPAFPSVGDVLRITLRATGDVYLATMRQIQNGHFGDERELAADIPFRLPHQRLLELSADRMGYGEALTDAFFADYAMRAAWQRARDQAERLDQRLQVRIEIDSSAAVLHHVCWETLQDPERRRFLAQNIRTPLVRYIHASSPVPLVPVTHAQLRALVIVAGATAPAGYQLPPIHVPAEISRVKAALGSIPIVLLGGKIRGAPSASIRQIRAVLQQGFGIVYVVCHGVLVRDESDQVQPYLWLETDRGTLAPIKAQQLVDLIEALDSRLRPVLVVFSSCYSAEDQQHSYSRRLFQAATPAAVAPRLAAAGVRAVIGMQGLVQQQFVERFIPTLFAGLIEGEPIDSAFAAARVDAAESDWWAPVLYLRGDNPYLWRATDEGQVVVPAGAIPLLPPNPAVREVIGRFEHDLKSACEQLPLLKAYKDIHDQLHHLLVRGIYCVERDLGPRLTESTAAQEFQGYYLQAQMRILLLYEATARLPQGADERRLIEQLERSYQRLARAVDRRDSAAFKAAVIEIYSGLATLPVSTNRSIVEQVRVLRIDQLSSLMQELKGAMSRTGAAARIQGFFAARALTLDRLGRDLQALVNRHTEWQALDRILRLLEQQGDIDLVPYHWEELQFQVEAVRQLEPEETRATLLEYTRGLAQALTTVDKQLVMPALDRLAREVRYRFFGLDKQLKEHCDGLQPLGSEFKLLLEVLTP